MENWIAYLLVDTGCIYVVTRSTIAAPLRLLFHVRAYTGLLVYCPGCAGFWIGAALAPLLWPLKVVWWLAIAESAFASCGLGSLLAECWDTATIDWELEVLRNRIQERQAKEKT